MVEPAAANGQNVLANLTPAELAQQARQRDGARQVQRPADIQPNRNDAARPDAARAVRLDAAEVPAVRAADLTQRAQFELTAAEAAQRNTPEPDPTPQGDVAATPAPESPGANPRAAANTEAQQRDPDPLVQQDSFTQDDTLTRGDIAQPENTARAFGDQSAEPVANPERAAQFREVTEQARFLQNAGPAGNPEANDNTAERREAGPETRNAEPSTNEQAAERVAQTDISLGGTANDPAGPNLPRGSTLSLVA